MLLKNHMLQMSVFGPEAHSGELAWVDGREPFVVSGKTETDVSLETESRFGSRVPDHP